jgi:zinc/manganese transport system substrate-binding protein
MRTILISTAAAAALAGCGGRSQGGGIDVVAAENVYGDVAAQIGGPYVHVTSILSDPNADPHLFTPRSSTGLAVARARVVIRNGLGYDTFVDKLLAATPAKGRIVITAGTRGANPHVWYDPNVVRRLSAAVAGALGSVDPSHAQFFERRERRFLRSGIEPVLRAERQLRKDAHGEAVAYTEPLPGYLVAAAGLRNLAPPAFTRAIEDGSEPPPSAVAAMLSLVRGHEVRALLYNSQTVSPITARIRDAARTVGIPVVAVTETLPPGFTYQSWQLREVRALAAALRS